MKWWPSTFLGIALCLNPRAVRGEPIQVLVKPLGHNTSEIFLKTDVQAPAASLWKWLTDYDHQAGYMPYMARSRVVGREGPALLVEQAGTIHILFWTFTMKMKQRVSEEAPTHMHFRTVEGDFSRLEGDFNLRPIAGTAGRTRLECQLTVQPKRSVPDWAVRMAARRYLRKMVHVLAEKAEGNNR